MRHLVRIAVNALCLSACGGAPPSQQQAIATISAGPATPIPPPTIAATPKPTAILATELPGLNLTRTHAQAKFEAAPFNFTFKDDPTAENGPAVRGSAKAGGVEVIFRGPAENIREAQMSAISDERHASADDALRAMIALLEVAAPAITQPMLWLKPHLDKALKTGNATAIESDRTIILIAEPNTKILILSVQPGL